MQSNTTTQPFGLSGWTTGLCYWIALDYTAISNELVAECFYFLIEDSEVFSQAGVMLSVSYLKHTYDTK